MGSKTGGYENMSKIYQQIIQASEKNLQTLFPCNGIRYKVCAHDAMCGMHCCIDGNCVSCLSDMFRKHEQANRVYNCLPITYTYTLRFLNRYASEVYHILNTFLDSFTDLSGKNIVSIGCGPATELVALERICRENSINSVQYHGFDMNTVWESVQSMLGRMVCNPVSTFYNNCLKDNTEILKNAKLLIANYLLSDIYKHSNNSCQNRQVLDFLNNSILPIFNAMPKDSYLLINDVNSCNMGRDDIEEWFQSLDANLFERHWGTFEMYYKDRNGYLRPMTFKSPGTILRNKSFVFSDIIDLFAYSKNVTECNSAFVLIKKKL